MTAYATFLADPQRIDNYLFEPTGLDPATSTERTLYFSLQRFGTGASDTPASQRYDKRLLRGLRLAASVGGLDDSPLAGLLPARQGGSIAIGQIHGDLDRGELAQLNGYPLRQWSFGGRSAVVRHGGYSPRLGRELAFTEYQTIFDGDLSGEPLIGTDQVDFVLVPPDARFESPFESRRFFGTDGCIVFDGTNDAVDCGTGATFNFTAADFSWEFMLYVEANPGSAKTIISRGLAATDGYDIRLETNGAIAFRTHQGAATQTSSSSAIPLHRWVRVSVTRTGATAFIRFDGEAKTSTFGTHVDPATSTRNLYFGRDNAGAVFFAGALDDIRCWSAFRTESEVNEHAFGPLDAGDLTACVGYWPADDGSGSATLVDSSATGADGTVSGAVFVPSCQGTEELSGRVLPNVWGRRRAIPPILVDGARQIYVVHAGPIDSFERVDVGGGSALVAGTPYTSWLTMMTASPTAAGKYDTCITDGWTLIRLGGQPSKPFALDVKGDKSGGTWRSTASELVRYWVCNRGRQPLTDPTDLDTDSFDDLDTATSETLGIWIPDEATLGEVVNRALASVGAVGYFTLSGSLFTVERNEGAATKTATVTLTERDVAQGTLQPMQPRRPVWSVVARYRENDRPLSSDEILAAVISGEPQRMPFLRNQWQTRSARNAARRIRIKDARDMVVETLFDLASSAKAEAVRLLALHDTPDQGFSFLCREAGGLQLDRMNVVVFDYGLLDALGVRRNRFGTSSTTKFLVLAAEPDIEAGGVRLTLWREEAA